MRGGEGDREHQGDLRESLLHTSGAQSDGLTATHGLFTGEEAAHVLRVTYARVAVAVSPVLNEVNVQVIFRWGQPGKATARPQQQHTNTAAGDRSAETASA